jgi:hypothetical protein
VSDSVQDELWPHFLPLWTDLREIAPGLLLAGGYGLFLKQQWLISQLRFLGSESGDSLVTERRAKPVADEVGTLVAIHRWNDQTPRVTKDFDFIASVDLIASQDRQQRLHEALGKHGFDVVPANARWQFEKKVGEGRSVVLDFHAPSPAEERGDLRVQSRRVKPQPSLGQIGIHGRVNPEAASSELYPFSFTYDGVEIVLPNPVTLTLMKLVAMSDRRSASQDTSISADKRQEEDRQARKHAEDVCRVMAMMTREESEFATSVLEVVRMTPVFAAATATFSESFQRDENWGSQVVTEKWQAEDLLLIQDTLAAWFR